MIKIRNLSKVYKLKKHKVSALQDFNLNIREGEVVAILGPNGAGKSTLIKILSTLIYPTGGQVFIKGIDLKKEPVQVRPLIGAVLGPHMIYHRLTGRSNLKFYGTIYGVKHLGRRIEELVELVGLEEKIDHLVESYSAGMKSKLALARGLIHDPAIMFLDEPTIGLDPNISLKIRGEIKKLRQRGKTIILCTHYMVEAEQLADRIVILNRGRIVSVDTPQGIRQKIPSRNYMEIKFSRPLTNLSDIKGSFIVSRDQTTAMLPLKRGQDLNHSLKDILSYDLPIKDIKVVEPSLEEAFAYLTKNHNKKYG